MPRLARIINATSEITTPYAHGQREAAEQLRRGLARVDPHARGRYVARFLEEFKRAEAACSLTEVMNEAARADVIYVADYHALPAAQAFAVRFLNLLSERNDGSREVVLCLETFYERDQRWLEAFQRGELAEAEFLWRTRYETEWGYAWAGYRSLLRAARQLGVPVYGVDSPLRHTPRLIRHRDAAAAERLARLMNERPGAQFVVFIGESHLAAEHLPGKVKLAAGTGPGKRFRDVVIAQNVDELYWQQGNASTARPAAARVSAGKYCVFTATPLEKYQAYARVIEQWQNPDELEDRRETNAAMNESGIAADCSRLLSAMLAGLRLKPPRSRLKHARRLVDSPPEVYGARSFGGFAALLKHYGASVDDIKALRSRAQTIGCAYAPQANTLFVSAFDAAGLSEELARFIAAALRGQLWAARPTDVLTLSSYQAQPACNCDTLAALMLDEALVFFTSKLLAPHRAAPLPAELVTAHRGAWLKSLRPSAGQRFGTPTARQRAALQLLSAPPMTAELCTTFDKLAGDDALLRDAAVRYWGRTLGEKMYQSHARGSLGATVIHQLFAADFTAAGAAARLWRDWHERLA